MKALRAAMAGLYALILVACVGCGAGTPSASAVAQQDAAVAVVALNGAWQVAANLCLASPQPKSCTPQLQTAYGLLVAAANGVDAWGAGNAGNQSCLISRAAQGLNQVFVTMNLDVNQVPAIVGNALRLAFLVGNSECPQDGGAQ